jgi:hypothetical protein
MKATYYEIPEHKDEVKVVSDMEERRARSVLNDGT